MCPNPVCPEWQSDWYVTNLVRHNKYLFNCRYVAIVTPFKLHNKRSTRGCSLSIKLKILAIWLVSAAFSIPDAINTSLEVVETMEDPSNVTEPILICSPYPFALSPQYHIGVVLGKFLVYFVLPVVFIVLVYSLMARQLISSTDMVPSHGNHQQLQKQMQNRKSLAKVGVVTYNPFAFETLANQLTHISFPDGPRLQPKTLIARATWDSSRSFFQVAHASS